MSCNRGRRHGVLACLALVALGLQLLLTFGHHHDRPAFASVDPLASAACAADLAACSTAQTGSSEHAPGDRDDDAGCAICWAAAVAHVIVLGVLLGLMGALRQAAAILPRHVAVLPGRLSTTPFPARAPPCR